MKAVIPAAGFGTRFLPFTKSVPKELIPIVDKPVIQYVVEEAVEAGCDDILIILSSGKEALKAHFECDAPLERRLEETGRAALLEELRSIGSGAKLTYTYQHELDGLGGALRCAEKFVGAEPFAVLLGDNITSPGVGHGVLSELMDVFHSASSSVVALEQVPRERVSKYGIVAGESADGYVWKLSDLIEKPSLEEAPSDLAIASRYIFTNGIMECLFSIGRGRGGEYQLTDAMRELVRREPMYGVKIRGRRHDAGDKFSFLTTTLEFALARPEYREKLLAFMRECLNKCQAGENV